MSIEPYAMLQHNHSADFSLRCDSSIGVVCSGVGRPRGLKTRVPGEGSAFARKRTRSIHLSGNADRIPGADLLHPDDTGARGLHSVAHRSALRLVNRVEHVDCLAVVCHDEDL